VPAHYQIVGNTALAISTSVETGLRGGGLAAGDRLPAVRELAGTLRVSPATVAAAYQALRQRGIVETAGRNGTRIRPQPPIAPSRRGRRLPVPPDVLDLSSGEPDLRLLPRLPTPAALEQRGYRPAGPIPELVEAATARLAADGVPVPALTVTSGALDGIDRLLAAHLRPGDRVGVEDPGWANLLDLIAALGLTPVPIPVDPDGPTPAGLTAALATGIGALVVTTRAHNPTGAALTASRTAALTEILRGYPDLLVIEDDHAAELASVELHALAGATARWAFLRSVSKPYGPDLRLAVLAGDETTVARVEGRMLAGAGWVSRILQGLVVQLWRDDAVTAQVGRARVSYLRRREALISALAARSLPASGRTGINVWVPVPDETLAVARLRDAGYAVSPGALYRLNSPPAIRITISPVRPAGIEALADAVAGAVLGAGSRDFSA
jgi:DNA-binding transcriptional MocR family regulator